jgi:hypothetical protein
VAGEQVESVDIAIRGLIGMVFLLSSASKLSGRRAYAAFVASVRELALLPARAASGVAVVVVVAELAIWFLLAVPVPVAATGGFAIAALLLTVFAIGIASSVVRGARVRCRCFGASTTPLGFRHVVRNAVLAVVALVGVLAVPMSGPVQPGGLVVAISAGLLFGSFVALLDDFVELFRPQLPVVR